MSHRCDFGVIVEDAQNGRARRRGRLKSRKIERTRHRPNAKFFIARRPLGLGLIDHNQKSTAATTQIADK
jgi:hypothetical protein